MNAQNEKKVRIQRRIRILAAVYCLLLVWVIIFKTSVSFEEVRCLIGPRQLNLIPFRAGGDFRFSFRERMENFVIFVPAGIYLKMMGVRSLKAFAAGAAVSVCMEAVQYLTGLGVCDVTDVITNTAGCAAGVAVYCILGAAVRDEDKLNAGLSAVALAATAAFAAMAVFLFAVNR